jgi:hypothetical protein
MKTEDEGAIIMRETARKVVDKVKALLMEEIEKALPDDASPRNPARQMGTLITACTMLYGDMVGTFAQTGGKGEAVLIAGLLETLAAPQLKAVAKIAGAPDCFTFTAS